MKLSHRSKLSMCQLMLQLNTDHVVLFMQKHGIETGDLEQLWGGNSKIITIRDILLGTSPQQIEQLIQEIARTKDSIRYEISPRYRFDVRWKDFRLCLFLDGFALAVDEYENEQGKFVPVEPIIEGAQPLEDDLTKGLQISGLTDSEEILRVLENSAKSFLNEDYNGCLNNSRVALQTLSTSIARVRLVSHPKTFDIEKWGQVISYLRTSGFLNKNQEADLTGVFSFASPGSHLPVGLSEQEFVRLGRNMVVSCCYFLIKLLNASGK